MNTQPALESSPSQLPYTASNSMAVTSFNGDGGHRLRRVRFEPNEPGQALVAEKDGIHEADVRRGITVEDSTIGFLVVQWRGRPCPAGRELRA